MKKLQVFFLAAMLVIGTAIYVLVFGEVGLIVQHRLEEHLKQLEDNVASLQSENKILRERYYQLKENPESARLPDLKGLEIIILKFRNPRPEAQRPSKQNAKQLSLTEARLLYIFMMLFVSLLGYVYIGRLL